MKKSVMFLFSALLLIALAGCGGGGGSGSAGTHTYQGVVPAIQISNSSTMSISAEIVSAVVVSTTQMGDVNKSQTVYILGSLLNDTPDALNGTYVEASLDVQCNGTKATSPVRYSFMTISSIASGASVTINGGGINCGITNPGFPIGAGHGRLDVWDSEANKEIPGHLLARADVIFNIVP